MPRFILDTRLSLDHYILCTEAIRRGIIDPDDLNEGRRTMSEQWAFYRNQPPLAAFPSPNAPHIWALRPDHAIDANSWNGAASRLAKFYESLGVNVVFNVPGEDWHFQPTSAAQLHAAAKKILHKRDAEISTLGETETRINFFKFQLHYLEDLQTGEPYFAAGQKRPIDGWGDRFSDGLYEAVKAFQRDHKLKPNGAIGPIADRKIDRAYSKVKRNRKAAKIRAKERAAKVARGEKL